MIKTERKRDFWFGEREMKGLCLFKDTAKKKKRGRERRCDPISWWGPFLLRRWAGPTRACVKMVEILALGFRHVEGFAL